MAGKPALTLLHLGPGLANATANLHNARRAGTPLVNLVGARTPCAVTQANSAKKCMKDTSTHLDSLPWA